MKDKNEWGTPELTKKYIKATPGQGKKCLKFEEFIDSPEVKLYEMDPNEITEDELEQQVTEDIEALDWPDVVDLYDEDELIYEDEDLAEAGLTVMGRIKKRFSAIRTKKRRQVAKGIALRRVSSPKVLKKRAKLAARRLAYKRILRGRDKSKMSPAEKKRYEERVKFFSQFVGRMAIRLQPKLRAVEIKRIKRKRGIKK